MYISDLSEEDIEIAVKVGRNQKTKSQIGRKVQIY